MSAASAESAATPEGWPFWAPSDLAVVEHALDVAGLAAGERLVDLGCGDGQVLVAAARRGAVVEGVEVDGELAAEARAALAASGALGSVVVGDVFHHPIGDADVVFTYLSPATLQRLVPRLARDAKPGARLVTVDYAVPGLRPSLVDGRVHLYRLPAPRSRRRRSIGWPVAGIVTTVSPNVQQLSVLELVAPGGPVRVEATGSLAGAVTVALGADDAARGTVVAVDVRWEHSSLGDVVWGELVTPGCSPLFLATIVTDEDHEVWELVDVGVRRLRSFLSDPSSSPKSIEDLVAACDDERFD